MNLAPPSLPPIGKPRHIHLLTCLRGAAAWWVVAYHFRENIALYVGQLFYRFIELGYLAVDLFFVLSGCVIYLNYWRDLRSPSASAVGRFFVARLARIYPLHLFISVIYLTNVIAIALFSKATSFGERYDPLYYVLSLFLLQNWGFTDFLAWNVPAWSISAEFFSYLAFPVLCLVMGAVRTAVGALIVCSISALLLATIYASLGYVSIGENIPKLGAWRCLFEFAMGVCIAWVYLHKGPPKLGQQWFYLGASAALCYLGYRLNIPEYWVFPVAFGLLVYGCMRDINGDAALRALWPLIYLGQISYSTYLVHYFIKDWVKFILDVDGMSRLLLFFVYVALVLSSSVILFHLVEEPGRRRFRSIFRRS